MGEQNDQYYIEKVLKGEKGAFSYLVNKYSEMVYSISLKLLKNEADAEDLSQEVFVSAYRSLGSFKGNSKFSTWIYRIAYNKAISHLRKKNIELSTDNEGFLEKQGGIELQGLTLSGEESTEELLSKAIKQLTEGDQILVMLFYYEDQSIEEISIISGMSVSNVKIKLFRIRKRLKEILTETGSEMLIAFD